ncbi:PAS domain-containing protein [Chryseobacterium balustinum]|uniref:PAS domain-containing protein n=1 Tax=Chryseobacterium balustinum TaxID=246 RepID=UPI000F4D5D5F|nr:PAS domain-containing protein [Chryseobacterium balustinum]
MNSPSQINPERLLSILFYSPNATAVYTGNDIKIISVNQAMLHLWGKDRSVVGQTFDLALPELHDQPFWKYLRRYGIRGKHLLREIFRLFLKLMGS